VQDCTRFRAADNSEVNQRLRGRPGAFRLNHHGVAVDLKNVFDVEIAFICGTFCNGEAQGITIHDCAEIPARPQDPAASMELSADGKFLFVVGDGE
jgi:hypothetical protein